MRAAWRTLAFGAGLLLSPVCARAGDPTAHTGAAVRAASAVALLPEFAYGVGSPKFSIPTGTLNEFFCPYETLLESWLGSGCAYSDLNGQAINEPDRWLCLDIRQPPAISALNSAVSLSETTLANLLGSLHLPTATACNWNHFTTNPAMGSQYSAANTAQITSAWADEIPAAIERGSGRWSCSVRDWKTYYGRVVNGLHYIQDLQAEHHAVGNAACTRGDVVPSNSFDEFFSFDDSRKCAAFLGDASQRAAGTGPNPQLSCDEQIADPLELSGTPLHLQVVGLELLCSHGVTLACMGLERLVRHHCNEPGSPRTISCSGPPGDHSSATNNEQYCEGELFHTAGTQDFLTAATLASPGILADAARRWAMVCKAQESGIPDPPTNVAVSAGDPHVSTFDGVSYELQVHGESTLVKGTDELEIQARTRPYRDSTTVAINVAVAAHVAADVIAFYNDGRITLNHSSPTLSDGKNSLPGGGVLWQSGQSYVLVWPDNTQLRLVLGGAYLSPRIYLPDTRRGAVTGLLGNLDGSANNELVTRQGAVIADRPVPFETFHGLYVESWRVGDTSLFDYPPGQNTENFSDRSFPLRHATAASLTDANRAAATDTCQAAQVAPDWLDACVIDVGNTADPLFATDLALAPHALYPVAIAARSSGGVGGGGGGASGLVLPRSCKEVLTASPNAPSGVYTITFSGALTDSYPAYCDMTTSGGGWTKISSAVSDANVDRLKGASGKQMLKCSDSGAAFIVSPSFSNAWAWAGSHFVQVAGTWTVNGSSQACGSDPEFTSVACPTWWGVGCGNGPGGTNKLFPGVFNQPSCANSTSAHTNSSFAICAATLNYGAYSVFVRAD